MQTRWTLMPSLATYMLSCAVWALRTINNFTSQIHLFWISRFQFSLLWRHNERDGVSNYQPHDFLLNCLFRRRSKKTSKLRVTGLCEGNSPLTGEFPSQRPVRRKMFPFDDVTCNDLPSDISALDILEIYIWIIEIQYIQFSYANP